MGFTHTSVQRRARLTLDDSVQHLHHFCASLPAVPYAERHPIFTFEEHSSGGDAKSISSKVLLPNSIDIAVRCACSKSSWMTEKMARKDAAFEAYKALHHAGLVDEHLLPIGHIDEAVNEAYGAVQKRPSIVKVAEQIDVYCNIAKHWQSSCYLHGSLITLVGPGQVKTQLVMLLPVRIPTMASTFDLYWDQDTTFQLIIEPDKATFPPSVIASAAQITFLLLGSVFRSRIEDRSDFLALFMPSDCMDHLTWLSSYSGVMKAEALRDEDFGKDVGLVRDLSHSGKLYVFHNVRCTSSESTLLNGATKDIQLQNTGTYDRTRNQTPEGLHDRSTELYPADLNQSNMIEVKSMPKRADFLHPVPSGNATLAKEARLQWLPASACEVARLPFSYSRFALFVPAILHKVQVTLIVEGLCNTVLSPLQFKDRSLVASAISASSAREPTDYQRLETLGDSVLKYMTSLTLMAEHLKYHEGIRMYFRRIFPFFKG